MTQKSLYWPGVAPGSGADAGRYTAAEFWSTLASIGRTSGVIITSPLLRTVTAWTNIGVFYGVGNRLAVTSSGNNKITVATGSWMADGQPGYNDTEITDIAITSPAANPRIDRVIVRKNYTGNIYTPTNAASETVGPYTARITIISGAEAGSPVAPSLVQDTARNPAGVFGTAGTWDIPLAQYQISTGGVISDLTDEREWVDAALKRVIVPVLAGWNSTDGTGIAIATENLTISPAINLPDNKLAWGYGRWVIPPDFIDTMTVNAAFIPLASGNLRESANYSLGACGEALNTHTGSLAATTESVNSAVINCVGEMSIANATPGDFLSLIFTRVGNDALDTIGADSRLMGWIVEYMGWKQ